MLHYKLQYEWNGRTMHRIYTKGTPNVFSRSRQLWGEQREVSEKRRETVALLLIVVREIHPSWRRVVVKQPVASDFLPSRVDARARDGKRHPGAHRIACLFAFNPITVPRRKPPYTPFQKSSVPLMLLDKHDVPAYMAPTAANTPPELTMYEPVFLTAASVWPL